MAHHRQKSDSKDDCLYARVLKHKNQRLGEACMDGWWECRRITYREQC